MNKNPDMATNGTQEHSGVGDNIQTTNNWSSVSSAALSNSINEILTDLLHRKHNSANNKINLLSQTNNLAAEAKSLLNILRIIPALVDQEGVENPNSTIDTFIRNFPESHYLDIAHSVKILHCAKTDNLDGANAYFRSIESPGLYVRSAFYELVSTTDDLESLFEKNKHLLVEEELCAMVRRSLSNPDCKLAETCSVELSKRYPSVNSRFLLAISKVTALLKGSYIHFWSISATAKRELFQWISEIIMLLNETDGKDVRITSFAAGICAFCHGEHADLVDICLKYISAIDECSPNVARVLRSINGDAQEHNGDLPSELIRSKKDSAYRKDLVNRLEGSTDLTTDEVVLLGQLANSKKIQNWIDDGGSIEGENGFEQDYSMLELLCSCHTGASESSEKIRRHGEEFIRNHENSLVAINPLRLVYLGKKLIDANQFSLVCDLIRPHIPEGDIWPSETVCCYLNGLLGSQQFKTLDLILDKIPTEEWDGFVWHIRANQQEQHGEFSNAIESLHNVLEMPPVSIYTYYHLLHLHGRREASAKAVKKFLLTVPNSILETPSKMETEIVITIAKYGDFYRAERIILAWFIHQPKKSAVAVTDFYGSLLFNNLTQHAFSKASGDCVTAIKYKENGSYVLRLIVNTDDETEDSCLLDSSTPLAQVLLRGKDTILNMRNIEDIERVTPLSAAFTISAEIRQSNNTGNDPFMTFGDANGSPEESVQLLIKILSSQNNHEDLVGNSKLPLFMKGHNIGNGCAVQNAYDHLISKTSFKHPLPNFGIDTNEVIILDIYSILLLSLSGISKGLIKSTVQSVITNETRWHIERWLEKIGRKNQGRFGVSSNGLIWNESLEELHAKTAKLQKNIKDLLNDSSELAPHIIDMPVEISNIQDAVDISVFSSIKLSIANNLPWLCVDPVFAHLMHSRGNKVINANSFLARLSEEVNFEDRMNGIYLHAASDLPYPLTYEDMRFLSISKDKHAHLLLAKLLEKYPSAYGGLGETIRFTSLLLSNVLLSIIDTQGSKSSDDQHLEKLFNMCCRLSLIPNSGHKAEYKLTLLLASLFHSFSASPRMLDLIDELGSRFVKGHFLNPNIINQNLVQNIKEPDNI